MRLEIFFVLLVALAYAEALLTRLVGRLIASVLLAVSALGLCSIVAVFIADAM